MRSPGPVGEGGASFLPALPPWLLPFVTLVGGLISGLIVSGSLPRPKDTGRTQPSRPSKGGEA